MSRPLVKPLLRIGLVVVLAAIAGFHLQILWARFADGSVLNPLVVARWLASAALGVFFAGFRRRGISLLRGRGALILWLFVALVHGVGLVPAAGAVTPPAAQMPAEVFLFATPLGLAVATLFWAGVVSLLGGLGDLALLRRGRLALDRAAGQGLSLLAGVGPRGPPAFSF